MKEGWNGEHLANGTGGDPGLEWPIDDGRQSGPSGPRFRLGRGQSREGCCDWLQARLPMGSLESFGLLSFSHSTNTTQANTLSNLAIPRTQLRDKQSQVRRSPAHRKSPQRLRRRRPQSTELSTLSYGRETIPDGQSDRCHLIGVQKRLAQMLPAQRVDTSGPIAPHMPQEGALVPAFVRSPRRTASDDCRQCSMTADSSAGAGCRRLDRSRVHAAQSAEMCHPEPVGEQRREVRRTNERRTTCATSRVIPQWGSLALARWYWTFPRGPVRAE